MSLLLCDMAADVDCRRWSLVVREKSTVPSRRLKFSGFCVWKFCVRMGQSSVQSAWSPNCQPLPTLGLATDPSYQLAKGTVQDGLEPKSRDFWV